MNNPQIGETLTVRTETAMDLFTLTATLPHHSQMGELKNDRSVPAWEARCGGKFPTPVLLAAADRLVESASANRGVEWGDTRARLISQSQARFLRRAAELRGGTK